MLNCLSLHWVLDREARLDEEVIQSNDVFLDVHLVAPLILWKHHLQLIGHEVKWSPFIDPELLDEFDEQAENVVLLLVEAIVPFIADAQLVQGNRVYQALHDGVEEASVSPVHHAV